MLKNNKIVRRLAWILCLSLIVGLIPVGVLSMPTPVNAAPEGTVVFSDDVEAWNFAKKWVLTGTTFRWTPDPGYEYQGGCVLLIQGGGDSATSPAFAVTAGKEYTLNYWTKQLKPGIGNVEFRFYNASGALIKSAGKSDVCGAAEWTEKNVSAIAPAGATSAKLYFDAPSENYVVDVMTVVEREADPNATEATEATEATQPDNNLLLNGGFEDDLAYWRATAGIAAFADDQFSGSKSAKVADESNKQSVNFAQSVPVTPGKTYQLTAKVKLLSGKGGYVGVCGVGDASQYPTIDQSGAWSNFSMTVTIPAGYTAATVEIGSFVGAVVTFLVDDLTFTEVTEDPEPTQETEATEAPENNLAQNGGFEDGLTNWVDRAESTIDTSDKHSGNAALKLTDTSATASKNVALKVPVTPGKTYKLSVWTKLLSGKGGYAGVCNIGDATVYPTIDQSGEWARSVVTVTIPEGITTATIEIGSSVGAVVTFLVDDVVFEEVVEDTPAGGLVQNGDFEKGLEGWRVIGDGTLVHDAHGGSNAVKYVDDSAQSGGYICQNIPVVAGKSYKVTAWIKHISGKSGYVGICGIGEASVYTATGENKAWTKVTATVTVPEGYTTAIVEIGVNRSPVSTFLIDDVVVEEVTDEIPEETEATEPTEATTEATEVPDPDGKVVFEEAFENHYTPEGRPASVRIPNGWTASEHSAAVACGKYDRDYDGTYNLCMFNPDPTDRWIRSSVVKATPGYEYTVSFHEKKYQPGKPGEGGYAKIVFVDKDGNILKEYEVVAGTAKTWERKFLYGKAPKNAAGFYVEFSLKKPNGDANYFVDDLAVYEIEASLSDPDVTNPTEPTVAYDPMKPIDEKFDRFVDWNDANSGPEGWFSNDDNGTDYAPMIGLVDNSLSVDGYYLRLQKPGKWSIQTPTFPVEIGYEYTASFLARKLSDNDNFAGALQINFVNSRGKIIASEKITVGKTYGEWAEEALAAVAPIGALKAYLVFTLEYTNGRIEGDYAIDNFAVTRAEAPTFEYTPDPDSMEPTEFDTIFTEKFEKYYNPQGSAASVKVPTNWTLSEFTAAIGNAKYDNYDGTYNLVVQGRGDMWAKSPLIDAKEGNFYYAAFVEKKLYGYREGSGGYATVVFLDADGKILKEYKEAIGTSEKWTDLEIGGQAPAGTAKLYVEFGLKGAKGDPIYSIDNLEILEGKAKLPASNPSTPGTQPSNPSDPEDNAPTGDHVVIMTAYTMLTVAVLLAVLILKKRRFF